MAPSGFSTLSPRIHSDSFQRIFSELISSSFRVFEDDNGGNDGSLYASNHQLPSVRLFINHREKLR